MTTLRIDTQEDGSFVVRQVSGPREVWADAEHTFAFADLPTLLAWLPGVLAPVVLPTGDSGDAF